LHAEIVSVGTELLLGQIIDSNAAYLSKALSEIGVTLHRRSTVGDNMERLSAALEQAMSSADVVLTIGGLGPTMDDITRVGLAAAFQDPLRLDKQSEQRLRDFFEQRNVPMVESNLRQAMAPVFGRLIDNPNGTAPGLLFEHLDRIGIALPGPPNEFIPMVDNHVIPYLRTKTSGVGAIRSIVLRVAGLGESFVEDRVKHLMTDSNPTVAPYAKVGEVHLRVTAKADTVEEADRLIAERAALVREELGNAIYAENDTPIEGAVVQLLKDRRQSVSTAESCTGGLVAQRITDIPGSSEVFPGGVVAYSNAAKSDLIAVPHGTINRLGAVSPEVARLMADGVRFRFDCTYGIGVTGIAGPGGGSPEKPVGLVYLAVSGPNGCTIEKANYIGSRSIIRYRASQTVLNMLRLALLK
jgi:nicotinamide-nucleotide amidase